MGKAKKTRKFAVAKKIISPKDTRVKSVAAKAAEKKEKEAKKAEPRQVEQGVSALFFQYNTQLGELFHWILGRIAFVEILCHRSSSHFPLLLVWLKYVRLRTTPQASLYHFPLN